jgi:hypothetical protein
MELPGLCDYTNDLKGEDYISDLIPGIAENLPAVCCNHLPLQKNMGLSGEITQLLTKVAAMLKLPQC